MTRRRVLAAGSSAVSAVPPSVRALRVLRTTGSSWPSRWSARWSELWPLPALTAWALGWAVWFGLSRTPAPVPVVALCAAGAAAALAVTGSTPLRRWVIALGFPVSLAAAHFTGALARWGTPIAFGGGDLSQATSWTWQLPAWAWLLPLALLALAYPMSAWRDAPLFPTPDGALDALGIQAPLPDGARVLDAGCGLGHGLAALRRAYPHAQLVGVERSSLIAWAARLWCRRSSVRAQVQRGDMWASTWRGCSMVYLFQRPESLPRAIDKARAELDPGAWLASLEFPALTLAPQALLHCPDGRTVWLYQAPFRPVRAVPEAAAFVTSTGIGKPQGAGASRRVRR